ncbi:substrate-binding domain-containing protein [Planktothrix sp. FACHB-1355]|uniref:Substrate-binding domain-containing protein n=1 Tax=Aerosakkonema funiforme FACHB-1375 TaxID=2949571 RepID=A0A926VDN1_9CYAN|nr:MULTISPECIES: substrate-binding domain-containing protein [Oscillatoriales]MBD2181620.1 substrate-binding domain-containing protein [Aerosakkonema funiforme FACHB-1375]MBD3557998.1 substrate-binding domain-containing protein [Planktothrix sp. FACHB-1355]
MATFLKKESTILSIAIVVALAAITSGPLEASVTLEAVPEQSTAPASFPSPASVPSNRIVRIDGSSSMDKVNEALKRGFEKQYPGAKVEITRRGSDLALQSLLAGKIDLAAIGRPLTPQEKAQGLVLVPVAREKIAIVVGPDSAFKGGLTFVQFAQMFRGQITNWSQVGGPSAAIRFIDRPDGSDTRRIFRATFSWWK